jgi:hypothetical protein
MHTKYLRKGRRNVVELGEDDSIILKRIVKEDVTSGLN